MTIGTRTFVHNAVSVTLKKCPKREGSESDPNWDVIVTDDKGNKVIIYCFGYGKEIKFIEDLSGE